MTDELIDFGQGGDDGQDSPGSIQPISDTESLNALTLNRSEQNLRRRVEIIRSALEDLKYLADYDRGFAMFSNALFTLTQTGSTFTLAADGDLTILPMLSPGLTSGGRDLGAKLIVSGVPHLGTAPNDLAIVASSAFTGQRGYADGQNLDGAAVSVGANGITIAFTALVAPGGPGSIVATVTGNPKRHIHIAYGKSTPTTILDLVTFINADATSQGTWGLRHLIRASTSGGAGAFETTLAPTKLQGGYDAEAVMVTAAQLTDFFLTPANALADGETLAVAFGKGPVEVGGTGGRRQSLLDLPTDRVGGSVSNITPSVGSKLFNTGRNPELIPYAIPIGKLIGGEFFFLDGTRLSTGMSLGIGDSSTVLARLLHAAATGRGSGASMVGYEGSGAWHPDSGAPTSLVSDTVNDTLSSIVALLAAITTNNSGSRRVGGEVATGSANAGSLPLNLAAGSIRQQLVELLNGASSASVGGGVNRRVSERGHQMIGPRPIYKQALDGLGTSYLGIQVLKFRMDTAGRQETRAAYAAREHVNPGIVTLQPLAFRDTADSSKELLKESNIAAGATGPGWILFSDLTLADYKRLIRAIPMITDYNGTFGSGPSGSVPGVLVELRGVVAGPSGDGPGLYYVIDRSTTVPEICLYQADGYTVADFTGATFLYGTAKASIMSGVQIGQGALSEVLRVVSPPTPFGGVLVYAADSVMDVAGTPTYAPSPWMSVFMPQLASVAMDTARLGARYYGNSVTWFESATKTRLTASIPIATDAALLKGLENTASIDATQNHHHGIQYTRTIMYSVPFSPVGWSPSAAPWVGAVAVTTVTAATVITSHLPAGVTASALVSAKLRKVAAIVRCVMRLTTSGMTTGQRLAICVSFYSGAGLAYRHHIDFYVPANSPTQHVASWQCTVPVYTQDDAPYTEGQFYVRCGAKGFTATELNELTEDGTIIAGDTVDAAVALPNVGNNTFLTIKEVGGVFGYED